LVVVESPNKVKKVAHYLGDGFKVVATVGHFRDLPKDDLAVDLESMRPTYVVDPAKKDVVQRLKASAAAATEVLIATDPDREGEAISWHVAQVLGLHQAKRIEFHEITQAALRKAVAAPPVILDDKAYGSATLKADSDGFLYVFQGGWDQVPSRPLYLVYKASE
jgi:DNA topoisomerase-1